MTAKYKVLKTVEPYIINQLLLKILLLLPKNHKTRLNHIKKINIYLLIRKTF